MKTFNELYNLINEGGAAGHMAHPFDVPENKTGNDLINFFNKIVNSINQSSPSLKIDGVNASFRLVDTDQGKRFALDRGSMKPLDLQGITIDKLLDRFGEGHGMVNAGNKLLSIMNEALPAIEPELKQLGMIDNSNRFFNTEFVEGQSNVLQYENDFLAIHGINEFYQATPKRRASKEVEYNPKVLDSLIKKLNKYAEPYNFKVYGSVPTRFTKRPNYENVLNKNFNVTIKNEKIQKPLRKFLEEADNPFGEKIELEDGKKVGALSKFVYLQILNGVPVDLFVANEKDYQKAIDGAVIYHATRLLGDELLTTLTSDMGDVKYHEGIVIRDPKLSPSPVKVTGEFIVRGMESKFQNKEEETEIAPYYANYINNPPVFNTGEGTRLRQTPTTFGEMFNLVNEFEEVKQFKTLVVYPGRFHPFHKGHASVYNKLKEQFPFADIFISTSNKTNDTNSPFDFEDKKKMIQSAGIDPNFVMQTTNPYLASEIVSRYNSDNTKVIFAVSEKDMEGDRPRFKFGTKKDGTPSYFQPFSSVGESEFMAKHGYILTLPTMDFDILGKDIRSASEIRDMYKSGDEKTRNELIKDLYGSVDQEVKRIFDNKLI
tara:strand:- start:2091 stop:3893 length:1803 start_codon:yes stop_codon:yes gene_type:complete